MLIDAETSPRTFRDPVNWCKSSDVSPNFVEPVDDMLTTFCSVTVILRRLAFIVPETFNAPVRFN